MELLGVLVGTAGEVDLDALRATPVTYDHVGSTSRTPSDPGAREGVRLLGHGSELFADAREQLRSWVPQRSLGAAVLPDGVRPDAGETALVALAPGGRGLLIPVRVVDEVDEPRRYAFAYGTLPGHPEVGEQRFLLEHRDTDEVVLTIRIDAVPAPALRPVAPLVRVAQRVALARYLRSIAVERSSTSR